MSLHINLVAWWCKNSILLLFLDYYFFVDSTSCCESNEHTSNKVPKDTIQNWFFTKLAVYTLC